MKYESREGCAPLACLIITIMIHNCGNLLSRVAFLHLNLSLLKTIGIIQAITKNSRVADHRCPSVTL